MFNIFKNHPVPEINISDLNPYLECTNVKELRDIRREAGFKILEYSEVGVWVLVSAQKYFPGGYSIQVTNIFKGNMVSEAKYFLNGFKADQANVIIGKFFRKTSDSPIAWDSGDSNYSFRCKLTYDKQHYNIEYIGQNNKTPRSA